jgi:hypothetical protein
MQKAKAEGEGEKIMLGFVLAFGCAFALAFCLPFNSLHILSV